MSEPWTTKQHAWVKEQYHQGRKVAEFWEEFEPIFGVKRTKCAFYQYVKKIAIEEGRECDYHRKVWSEEEIKRLLKLHGVMKIPQIARVMGLTRGSVEGQVAKMRREGTLGRKKRERVSKCLICSKQKQGRPALYADREFWVGLSHNEMDVSYWPKGSDEVVPICFPINYCPSCGRGLEESE